MIKITLRTLALMLALAALPIGIAAADQNANNNPPATAGHDNGNNN